MVFVGEYFHKDLKRHFLLSLKVYEGSLLLFRYGYHLHRIAQAHRLVPLVKILLKSGFLLNTDTAREEAENLVFTHKCNINLC